MITSPPVDFAAVRRIAKDMTDAALLWTADDCWEAAQAAEAMERAGRPVSKSGGWYRDEGSVYRAEIARRRRDS